MRSCSDPEKCTHWLDAQSAGSFYIPLKSLCVRASDPHPSSQSWGNRLKNALTPKLDHNEIMRVNGRIKEFPLNKTNNEPIILHAKHPAIHLLIKYYHEKYFHGSHETVVNELRQNTG